MIRKVGFVSLGHDSQTRIHFYLTSSEFTQSEDEFSDTLLGEDFFRPESLRWDARPYFYKSLVSVKKVHSGWEVVIRGADEPKRALVVLDPDFKLVKVMRFSAAK